MQPLTIDDLLSLEEYTGRRREYFESHRRYVDRYRRVRVGPRLTLVFENRKTLWFRVQEIIRIARLARVDEIQQELSLYNRLLPAADTLQAALLIEIPDETKLIEELAAWRDLDGDQLWLRVGAERLPSRLVTCRPEDRCIGTAHWVQFHIGPDHQGRFADLDVPACFGFDNGRYTHQSPPLSDEMRLSLMDDLKAPEAEETSEATEATEPRLAA